MQLLAQRDVYTESFYTPEFYPRMPKVETVLMVEAEAGLSCKLHAQAHDIASDKFNTIWAESSFTNTSRIVIFTDQIWIFIPASSVHVWATRRMRWWVEMDGTGAITMQMGVFELNSTYQRV